MSPPNLPHRFRPERELGAGGEGTVWLVRDEEEGGAARALKTLLRPTAESIRHLKTEYRLLADVLHPNLVELHELGLEDGLAWFTMEFVDGVDFHTWVHNERGDGRDRLLYATRQLVDGVMALHEAGYVHRDLKPSNILVRPDGVLKVLDCGLATSQVPALQDHSERGTLLGTLPYLAPEGLAGQRARPALDVFAIGVILYEAVTGCLPFTGTLMESLVERWSRSYRPMRELAASAEPHLEELVEAMLSPAADDRPTLDSVRSTLASFSPEPVRLASAVPFVGRAAELTRMHGDFARAQSGELAITTIRGPAGIGKSALVRQFLLEKAREQPQLIAMAGRGQPTEWVPFQTLDGVIDALSGALVGIGASSRHMVVGDAPRSLGEVFPQLREVLVTGADPVASEPRQRRAEVTRALRDILARLAFARPVVVWIDDAQWADGDSLSWLRDVFARLVEIPLQLILSVRVDDGGVDAPALEGWPDDERLELAPLPEAEARILVSAVRGTNATDERQLSTLCRAGEGVPLLLKELASAELDEPVEATQSWNHASLLRLRTAELGQTERDALWRLALASGPLPSSMVCVQPAIVRRLHKLRLVQFTAPGQLHVDVVHDWIRDAVRTALSPEQQRSIHEDLAHRWMDEWEAPEEALHHFQMAGQHSQARELLLRAAVDAERQLAFMRAARLLKAALDVAVDDEEKEALLQRRARALVHAGCGGEGAALLLQLASRTRDPGLAARHRAAAAEQYLFSGHTDEGLRVAFACLRDLGFRTLRSPLLAIAYMRWQTKRPRTKRWLRRPPRPRPLSARARRRLDLGFSISLGLSVHEPFGSAALQTSNLIESLAAGDPLSISRAVATHAMLMGGYQYQPDESVRLKDLARSLADRLEDPGLDAHLAICESTVALFEGRLHECQAAAERATELLKVLDAPSHWHQDSAVILRISALCARGQFALARPVIDDAMVDAANRGDLYLQRNVQVRFRAYLHLLEGRSSTCEADSQAGLEAHSPHVEIPESGFDLLSIFHAANQIEARLCAKEPAAAAAVVDELLRDRFAAFTLRLHYLDAWFGFLRGRIALALARQATAEARAGQLKAARSIAGRLAGSGYPVAQAYGALLRASAVEVTDADQARPLYTAAADACSALGMDHLCRESQRRASGGGEPLGDLASPLRFADAIPVPVSSPHTIEASP